MARLSGRWTAVLVLCAAAVACIVATTRLAHSPWCDGPTLLPSVLCSLHPTRWVSKGYYPPNLFKSRKGRAGGSPAASGLTTDLDAATDFGETAGGGAGKQQPSTDIPQPQQPAVDEPDAPADAKLDAVAEQMEAGGSQTSPVDQQQAGSAQDGSSEQQPEAPAQQQPDQQQAQQPSEQQPQEQQQLGEPAAEQPPKVDAGPAEQQRAEMPPDAQEDGEAAAQQDAPAEEQLPGQKVDDGAAQQDAPAEQQPEAQQQPQQQEQQPPDEQQAQQQQQEAEPQQEQPQQTEQQREQQQEQQPPQAEGGAEQAGEQQQAEADVHAEDRLPPVREWVGDQEVIWEKPRGQAKGVFLAFNGCNHGPDGWWDPQPACPDCLGLPEEKNIVRAAVERGYVAIALAVVQQRRRMRCWANLTPPNWNHDMNATVKTVKTLTEREGWTGLPLTAWGGSAGGSFAARLPYYLPMQGIMVQLKSVAGSEVQADPTNLETGEAVPYPKVVYAYNRRDPTAKERAYAYTDALKDKGIDFVLLAADPHPLAPHFFADRIEDIDAAVSQQLFDALKGGGFLDDHNYLIEDPRKSDKRWQAVLREQVPYAKTAVLTRFISPIFEELNWAFSNHQGISDCTAASFEFFETGVRPDEKMLENPEWWELQEQAHAH